MGSPVLEELQRLWFAEDTNQQPTNESDANQNPFDFIPSIGSMFNKTKVSSATGISYSGSAPFNLNTEPANTKARVSSDSTILIIAGIVTVSVILIATLKQ